jgi:hydrogenase large subunit
MCMPPKGNKHCQRVKEQVDASAVAINKAIPKALGLPETNYTPSSCCPPP